MRDFLGRQRGRRRGLVALISDFYDPAGRARGAGARPPPPVRGDRHPDLRARRAGARLRGDSALRDVETGETRELTISPRALSDYARRHAPLLRELAGYCRERAIPCFTVTSDQPFDAVVLRMFRAGGLLG